MKKRKLNSKNPKYWDKSQVNTTKITKEIVGNCITRSSNGKITNESNKIEIKGVWYEQRRIKKIMVFIRQN